MRSLPFFLAAGCCLFIFSAGAKIPTNLPPTQIENFELQTDAVIVKGFSQAASMSTSAGTISVRCKQSENMFNGRKEYAVAVALTGNETHKFFQVDYDELAPLIHGMDFLAKINYDATPMPGFDANFTTRSGLKISARGEQRQIGIQDFVQFGETPRIPLTTDEFARLENLIVQAKATLDQLQNPNPPASTP